MCTPGPGRAKPGRRGVLEIENSRSYGNASVSFITRGAMSGYARTPWPVSRRQPSGPGPGLARATSGRLGRHTRAGPEAAAWPHRRPVPVLTRPVGIARAGPEAPGPAGPCPPAGEGNRRGGVEGRVGQACHTAPFGPASGPARRL